MSGAASSQQQLVSYGKYLMRCVPHLIERCTVHVEELSVHVAAPSIVPTLRFLRDHWNARFQSCVDVTAADYPSDPGRRFHLFYALLSTSLAARLTVVTETAEAVPVPSVSSVYASAVWAEREVYDLFGVVFSGHPDLRRILTDYGFEGHPLRKDFPLSGHTEIRYDENLGRVVSEPVQLTQEYRRFTFDNPVSYLSQSLIFGFFGLFFPDLLHLLLGVPKCLSGPFSTLQTSLLGKSYGTSDRSHPHRTQM